MAVDIEAVTELCRQYAEDVRRAMPVDRAVLFGSYAKGTADEGSDIDLCFFLDSYNGRRRIDIMFDLFKMVRGYKRVPFEPIVFETSEIENDNPFVKEILRTGRDIL
jgi:predicted nucleotidyltransferase